RGTIEQTAPAGDRKFRYRVDGKAPFRVSERHHGIRHDVADYDQSVAARDLQGDVARSMPRRIEHPHAAHDLAARPYGLQSVLDAREIALCPEREAPKILGQSVGDILGHPEIPFAFRDEIACVWKTQGAAVVGNTPQMVRMSVREY